jgi:hypothetical protein
MRWEDGAAAHNHYEAPARKLIFDHYSLHSAGLKPVTSSPMDKSLTNSRREFLRRTLLGTAFLTAAKIFPRDFLFARSVEGIPSDLRYFSAQEYLILQALAERIIGPMAQGGSSVKEIDPARRADQFLATADLEIQDQFHQLLTVFNAPFFTFLFDLRFSSFINMAPEDKDSYLEDWMTSNLALRRTGFQALKRLCLSMFYTDSRSWKEIGYEGMFLPEDHK